MGSAEMGEVARLFMNPLLKARQQLSSGKPTLAVRPQGARRVRASVAEFVWAVLKLSNGLRSMPAGQGFQAADLVNEDAVVAVSWSGAQERSGRDCWQGRLLSCRLSRVAPRTGQFL
jgi:hypothetical protein